MALPPVPNAYFHMSGASFAPGDVIRANGQEKLPTVFEEPLERYRPANSGPRRDFVYCRPEPIFDRCGIVDPKYIYRVEPVGKQLQPQVHDLAWIGPMQMAVFRQKYGSKLSEAVKKVCGVERATRGTLLQRILERRARESRRSSLGVSVPVRPSCRSNFQSTSRTKRVEERLAATKGGLECPTFLPSGQNLETQTISTICKGYGAQGREPTKSHHQALSLSHFAREYH